MAASYPSSAKSFTPIVDATDYPQATQLNQVYDEVQALEAALLTSGLAHHLKFVDATYDIGQSGATRPRDLFLSRNAVIGGTLGVTGTTTLSGIANLASTVQVGGVAAFGVWNDWSGAVTLTGYSGAPTVTNYRYHVAGKLVSVMIDFTGTSNATTLTFTIPFAAKISLSTICGACVDNGVSQNTPPRIDLAVGSATVTVYRLFDATGFTASGVKALRVMFTYEAN